MSKHRKPKKKNKHANTRSTQAQKFSSDNAAGIFKTNIRIENIALIGFVLSVFWLFSTQLNSHFTLPKLTAATIFTAIFLFSHLHRSWNNAVNPLPLSLQLSLAGLALWWILGTSQAIHLQTALEGQNGRYNGFLTNIFWLILFIAIVRTPIDSSRQKTILRFLYFASIFVCIYAIAQYLGLDPLLRNTAARPFSSIGNPVSLGAVVLMIIPFALNDLIHASTLRKRLLLLGLLSLLLFTELITGSRGPWIAGLVAIPIVLIGSMSSLKSLKPALNRYSISLAIIVVAGSIFFMDWSPLLERFTYSDDIKRRLMYFSVALEAIKDNPLLGNGFESFRLVYPEYRPFEDASFGKNVTPTMVHNDFLQLATDNGLPALLFYLAFISAALRILFKAMSNPGQRGFMLASIASIIGFLVQGMSGWSEVASSAVFWLILGLAVSVALSDKESPSPLASKWKGMVLAGSSLAFLIPLVFTMTGTVKADYNLRKMQAYQNSPTDKWINRLDYLGSNNAYYQDRIGLIYLKRLFDHQKNKKGLLNYRFAAHYFSKSIQLNLYDPYSRIHLMQADTIALRYKIITRPTPETMTNITALEKIDPNNPTIYEYRARLYFTLGMMKEGAVDMVKAKSFVKRNDNEE